MGQLVFQATLGGQVSLSGPNTASTYTLNVPAVSATLATTVANTFTADQSINGLTVGLGGGAVATNTAVGTNAINGTGFSNSTAIGYQALYTGGGGTETAIGSQALYTSSSTAGFNTAVGYRSLYLNSTGLYNVAMGVQSLNSNTTASNNTAVGYQAGYSNTTGAENSVFGTGAGYNLSNGNQNTILGRSAGFSLTTGSNNVFVGYQAGQNLASTTATNCVYIGSNSAGSAAGNTQELVIGTVNTSGKGSTTGFISPNGGGVYQGNNSTLWAVTSDARLKKNIVDNTQGLDKILSIQVRNFEYRLPEEITEVPQNQAIQKTGIQLGAIAQELQVTHPECVKQESTGVFTVNADPLVWYLINAVKELNAKVTALEAQLGAK